MFDFLVGKVNDGLRLTLALCRTSSVLTSTVSSFDVNSFEQLCINFATRSCSSISTSRSSSRSRRLPQRAIKVAEIKYRDNQDCIDLLELPRVGVINILDEECKMLKATDKSFAQKLHSQHARHLRFAAPKMQKNAGMV